jgi:hypothetical protein
MIEHGLPWLALLLLGAVHGVNPGLGGLFAVALGLQEQSGRAVWRALPPLALGHALAIALAVLVAAAIGTALPVNVMKALTAAALFTFGVYRLVRHRHRRFGGMRVNARDLTVWSFLMANAHGAGLMVLPILIGKLGHSGAQAVHEHGAPLVAGWSAPSATGIAATATHSGGYLLVTGAIALVVYKKLGLRLLRNVWFNLDVVWAAALVLTAVLTILL